MVIIYFSLEEKLPQLVNKLFTNFANTRIITTDWK